MNGATVLITGGGTGIGRATALLFRVRGATVVVAGRRATGGDRGGAASGRCVASPDDVARMIVFLAGPEAAFVTGGVHAVDEGMAAL